MTGVVDSVRDYAQNHPVAASLIIALPGTYFLMSGNSITCNTPGIEGIAKSVGLCRAAISPSNSPVAGTTPGLTLYESQHPLETRLVSQTSPWEDKPTPWLLFRIIQTTSSNVFCLVATVNDRLELRMPTALGNRWAEHFAFSRLAFVAITTALPGAFLIFVRKRPDMWAAKHRQQITTALHIFVLVTITHQRVSLQDVLVVTAVMLSFEALRRASELSSTQDEPHPFSGSGNHLNSSNVIVTETEIVDHASERTDSIGVGCAFETGEEEIDRLRRALVQVQTADKNKETDLRRTQIDLRNARDTLNDTFAEYTSLRDEMKTVKQTIGRDHQAIIYRKDIELFALRKGNEQKENYIKEKEAKLEDLHRSYRAALDLKDAQMRNLKERVAFLERQQSHSIDSNPGGEEKHPAALQVKLLRVQGRNSVEVERPNEETVLEIAKLKEELAEAQRGSEAVSRIQDELHRAWNSTYEMQNALNDEQQNHAQVREKYQEVAKRLEEEMKKNMLRTPLPRLETIQEQDRQELEVMFNAAQQDNLKLYAELETKDKLLRETSVQLAAKEQDLSGLREELKIEKSINEDMEAARPSVVHRAHYQRMEGQLKEIRYKLTVKIAELEQLQLNAQVTSEELEQNTKAKKLLKESLAHLQDENTGLKRQIAELEAAKEQLMLDHERLSKHRTRETRISSAEYTSARSSGATLITDPSNRPISAEVSSQVPVPSRPTAADVVVTNDFETNRFSLISTSAPPLELRSTKRKSLTLKGIVRKLIRRDEKGDDTKEAKSGKEITPKEVKDVKSKEKEALRPRTALGKKDKNVPIRPKTAAELKPSPKNAAVPMPKGMEAMRPKTSMASPSGRYYHDVAPSEKGLIGGEFERPKSGWGSQKKLLRRSMA
ncbi:hypothetical protein P154DRAFT_254451 [Amniculicola lignicola CBS 123094]|uniref:Uncharacterized protein n=1 Tax=Amniculicola lignicola CBS 123094 TaxID=1392246 RepID=A0A6A5WZE0_9PLEO|nr:hypothetical protein P154DRAFT_254451 [Amniculicola lignicola CBS 123094]